MTRIPAATAPVTPATESSMTSVSDGSVSKSLAACRKTSGAGLPRPSPTACARRRRDGSDPRALPGERDSAAAPAASSSRCSADRRACRASLTPGMARPPRSGGGPSPPAPAHRCLGQARPSSSATRSKISSVVRPAKRCASSSAVHLVAELGKDLAIDPGRDDLGIDQHAVAVEDQQHGCPFNRLSRRSKRAGPRRSARIRALLARLTGRR